MPTVKYMKKWSVLSKLKKENTNIEDVIDLLLKNRGIMTKKDREDFLHPTLEDVTTKSVGIASQQQKKTLARIRKAIESNEQIVVFGDYDVDGITGTAILWEILYAMGA